MRRTVEQSIERLATLSPAAVRDEWQLVMAKPVPPAFTTDLPRRAIAYRIQEEALEACHLRSTSTSHG